MNKTIDVLITWQDRYKSVKNCDLIDMCTLPTIGPVNHMLIINFGLPEIPLSMDISPFVWTVSRKRGLITIDNCDLTDHISLNPGVENDSFNRNHIIVDYGQPIIPLFHGRESNNCSVLPRIYSCGN